MQFKLPERIFGFGACPGKKAYPAIKGLSELLADLRRTSKRKNRLGDALNLQR